MKRTYITADKRYGYALLRELRNKGLDTESIIPNSADAYKWVVSADTDISTWEDAKERAFAPLDELDDLGT
jgi:hypothetical protein